MSSNKTFTIKFLNSRRQYIIDITKEDELDIDSSLIRNIYSLDKSEKEIELQRYQNTFECILDRDLNTLIRNINLLINDIRDLEIKKQIEKIYDQLNYFGSDILFDMFMKYLEVQIKQYEKRKNELELEQFVEKLLFKKRKYNKEIIWVYLSGNSGISEQFFEKHLDKINCYKFSGNTNISEQLFEKYISSSYLDKFDDEKKELFWRGLSLNPNISEQFFKYTDKVVWHLVSKNRTEEYLEKNITENNEKLDWHSLSGNSNISEAFFERHIDKVEWEFAVD